MLSEAKAKLDKKPKNFRAPESILSTKEAVAEFENALHSYELDSWHVKIKKSMVADCLAGKGNALFVRDGATFDSTRMRMLVAHEIETHILTAENGKGQLYSMFNRGFANYLETQEGLAVWNQEQLSNIDSPKNYRSAELVFVIDFALKHSFVETFEYCKNLGMNDDQAFKTTVKCKRGFENTEKAGSFTKDLLYFRGYLQVQKFITNGGELKDLYYGKYNLKDLETILNLPDLKEPKLLPHFLGA